MTPTHQTLQSAGADLTANEDVIIPPNEIRLVGTGFKLGEYGHENLVFVLAIRSSLALKSGLMLANSIGVIDADYKDEVKAMLFNASPKPVQICKGTRIAQLVPMQYVAGVFPVADNERVGGFGSTNDEQ